jgi:hypothetical protein
MSASNKKADKEKEQEKQSGQGGPRKQKSEGTQAKAETRRRSEQSSNSENRRTQRRELEPYEVFEPVSAARIATLRLARNWRLGGNTYGAMHAYERILRKYAGTPAAHAAAEELIAMAGELERQGKFYTALNIFNKIEEYYESWSEEFYDPWRTAYVRPRRR